MCGRFARSFTADELIREINEMLPSVSIIRSANRSPDAFPAFDYNVAPTTTIPVVVGEKDHALLDAANWGFVSRFSSSQKSPNLIINARSESVAEKPTFRHLLREKRCAVPMDGFYEWQRSSSSNKLPYYVTRSDGRRMWVAGLWRINAEHIPEVVLLTAEAGEDISHIHHRVPCHLSMENALTWTLEESAPLQLLDAHYRDTLQSWRVHKDVNSIRNNNEDLIAPIGNDEELGPQGLFDSI
jgi:putative SOS response-associated peptidase YedK